MKRRTQVDAVEVVAHHVLDDLRKAVGVSAVPFPRVRRTFEAKIDSPVPQARLMPLPRHPLDELMRRPAYVPEALSGSGGSRFRRLTSLIPWLIGAGAVIATLLYVSQYGITLKGRVIQQGNAAISDLIAARDSIEQLDIGTAQQKLESATSSFERAASQLNVLGPRVTRILAYLPGFGSLRTGQDLLEIGRLLSEAGTALSDALGVLSRSGSLIDDDASGPRSMDAMLDALTDALAKAQLNLQQARLLAEEIDVDAVPEAYRGHVTELRDKMPMLEDLVSEAERGVAFLRAFGGGSGPKRYLVLFSNTSELRPTGGFPGSYGILAFEGGRLRDFHADDIYNPDGQIRELVVPPTQLQHITPGWGMRDAGWWADFPTSARKTMEFWKLGGGTAVDGVIAIQPAVLADILRIIGPIRPPGSEITLTADNVLPELQREVEYGIDKQRGVPKQIITDLAPIIVERMASLRAQQWASLLQVFRSHLATRAIMMQLNDPVAQRFVTEQMWDGRVLQESGDFLSVNVANVKGAKADAVTDTTMKLEAWMKGGTMVHRLTLTRQHTGGRSEYGFYNKPNYSWIRVLVPRGSVLRGIDGNDRPSYQPLMTYAGDAVRDPDLDALERTYRIDDARNVTVFEESDKTAFGFWHVLQPGETRTVQLEYEIPATAAASDYRLLVQRQPGLRISDFEFSILTSDGTTVESSEPTLMQWPDSWRLHDDLADDLRIRARVR